MTPTDLAAALLRDVPTRYQPVNGDRLLHETDVLTALSRALDPALSEKAGEVLEGVTPGPWETVFDRQTWGWLEVDGPSFKIGAPTRATDLSLADEVQRKKDALFIAWCREGVPALLAQNATLRAERDTALGMYLRSSDEGFRQKDRAEAAEAVAEKLRAERDALIEWNGQASVRAESAEDRAEAAEAVAEKLRKEIAFTATDGQRLLRKIDVIGVCDDPDLCFDSEGSVARCGPCAVKIAARDGVVLNEYTRSNPQAMRLQRELSAAEAKVEKLRGALQIARVHVANNAEGWSVSRGAARDDLTIVDAALTTEERK